MDTQGYRVARIWHRAGEFISGRLARACGDGQAARRKRRLRVSHGGPGGPALVGKARAGKVGRKNRWPDIVVSHGRRPRKTFTKTWDHFLLPMPFARTVILFARP